MAFQIYCNITCGVGWGGGWFLQLQCLQVLYNVTVLEGKGKVISFPCLFPGQHDLAVSNGKIKGKMHSPVNFQIISFRSAEDRAQPHCFEKRKSL